MSKAEIIVALAGLPENDPRLVAVGAALRRDEKPDRILSRSETAQRFNRSTRAVALWARAGILQSVMLPGRKRGVGFRESDVARLIAAPSAKVEG